MSDALPSNAGDRYHFVYTARRMLDMLHPRSDLELIEMENVAKEDRLLANTPETFVGVDLTEYYGGVDSDSAKSIVIVQVKYSPTNPTASWTLNRLCSDKLSSTGTYRPGTSVLRKLANSFDAFYANLGEATSQVLAIRLYTNQPLDDGLHSDLSKARSLVYGKSDRAGSKILRGDIGELRDVIDEIQRVTNLSWKRLAAFLKSWDLLGFGQAMLSATEGELFQVMTQYVSGGGVHFGGLLNFVQEHAVSNRLTQITPQQVLAQLRLHKLDLFPAPTHLAPVEGLLYTETAESIVREADNLDRGIFLVHGVSGTGKSVALQLVAQYYGDGNSTVIYDCYANGAGLRPGAERFPYQKFLVQITNDLDALFHTNILATTSLRYERLVEQFEKALAKAASLAQERGHRLIIAIDAVDNAVDAASRSPIETSESFVPLLWRLSWPENCVVIVSARTENLPQLDISCVYREIEIEGFTHDESIKYIRSFWPDADDHLVEYVHERTNGNPRVQSKLIEDAKRASPSEFISFVDDKARKTAFEYYEEECPKRLQSAEDRLLLAVLFEATQFVSIDTLSQITQRSIAGVNSTIESLYFGLRVSEDGEILWRDQDFLDFAKEYVSDTIIEACLRLADYCKEQYNQSEYARANLSRHFFRAEYFEQLLNWWLEKDRLIDLIVETKSDETEVLDNIRYGLLAAIEIGRFGEGLQILSIAADVLQGRDVFGSAIMGDPSIAVECDYLDRLLGFLEANKEDKQLAGCYFSIACALAERREQLDTAEDLVRRGFAIIRQESMKYPGREGGFSLDNVCDIALFEAGVSGFSIALENMRRWEPQETVYPAYVTLAQIWSPGREEESLTAIESVDLNEYQRAYAVLGVLGADGCQLDSKAFKISAEIVRDNLESGVIDFSEVQNAAYKAAENSLSLGLPETARDLLTYYRPSEPEHSIVSNIIPYLKSKALRTLLSIEDFDPGSFELEPLSPQVKDSEGLRREREQRRNQIRARMTRLYPVLYCRVGALAGEPSEEVLQDIQKRLGSWLKMDGHRRQEYLYDFVDVATFLLEAITFLPKYHRDLVQQICDAVDSVLSYSDDRGYARYADILSRDSRYYAQAEELIRKRRQEIRSAIPRAGEAVQELLSLYPAAARFDKELAYGLFSDARLAAGEWDGDIGGRAFALLRTASHIQGSLEITEEQLVQLAAVFERMKRVAFDSVNPRLDEAIRLISGIRLPFALSVLEKLEQDDLLDFSDGMGSVILGLLDARSLPPGLLWPLVHIVTPNRKASEIFRRAISQQIDLGESVRQSLEGLAQLIRVDGSRRSRVKKATEFVNWASERGLANNLSVESMREFVGGLNAIELDDNSKDQLADSRNKEQTPLFAEFLKIVADSPQLAIRVVEEATPESAKSLQQDEIEYVVEELVKSLPSSQIPRLLPVVSVWGEDRIVPVPFKLLAKISKYTASSTEGSEAVAKSLQNLLTPHFIHQLTREYYQEYLEALLNCDLDVETRLTLIFSATARSLRELHADDLYMLVGYLGEMLPPAETAGVFETLLQRSVAKLPNAPDWEIGKNIKPADALIGFLSDYLGHPRQVVRWRVLYSLIDMALNVPEPTLSLLVKELYDEEHERWMTKREWILFVLHHLSLRSLAGLDLYVEDFLAQALDKSFPHAKIRYHAKEILLHIEEANPGTLVPEKLSAVRAVNEPIALMPQDEAKSVAYEGIPWNQRQGREFWFDSMDTLPYWYSPVSHCFARHRCHVADIAYRWIVDKWNITDEKCQEERSKYRGYNWEDFDHRHGHTPAIENLERYVERHGMFMAAGELVDSVPVVPLEEGGDKWHDWMRYRLRAADPALIGRFVDAPPLYPDNYGIFLADYEEWAKKGDEEDFRKELFIGDAVEWLVVAASREGRFYDRQFRASVISALVSKEAGQALVRLISSSDDYVPLPYIETPYDTVLSELEEELGHPNIYYTDPKDEIRDERGLFVLKSWLVRWYQEMPFHSFDPKWPENGRGCYLLGLDFCSRLGIQREPNSLTWTNDAGERVAYHEIWYDHDDTSERSDYAVGHCLVVRTDVICCYLKELGYDMIFVVNLSRQRPSWYRRDADDGGYDHGTKRAYILTAEGELR
jgi:hypothetical protein